MTDKLEITLTDTYGKRKTYALKSGKNGLVTKRINTDRGFGESHTDYAEINGYTIPGDMWRFFEGTLGEKELFTVLTTEDRSIENFLESFSKKFNRSSDDDAALLEWESLVKEDDAVNAND